jgi:hypothetical protein
MGQNWNQLVKELKKWEEFGIEVTGLISTTETILV